MPKTYLIDFDETIFAGHLHNLITHLYSEVFLPWQEKQKAEIHKLTAELLQQAKVNAAILSEHPAAWQEHVKKLEAQLASLHFPKEEKALNEILKSRKDLSLEQRWAIKVFWPGMPALGVEDPAFDQRCLAYLKAQPEYAEGIAQMLIHTGTHTWKQVIESLMDQDHKMAIVSFSAFPSLLRLVLKDIVGIAPEKLQKIKIVSWLPADPSQANKNHHIQQALMLLESREKAEEVVLVDDSLRNLTGASQLGYSTIQAVPDGQHLTAIMAGQYVRHPVEVDAVKGAAELSALHSKQEKALKDTLEKLNSHIKKSASSDFVRDSSQKIAIFREAMKLAGQAESQMLALEACVIQRLRVDPSFTQGEELARNLMKDCCALQQAKENLMALENNIRDQLCLALPDLLSSLKSAVQYLSAMTLDNIFSQKDTLKFKEVELFLKDFERFLSDINGFDVKVPDETNHQVAICNEKIRVVNMGMYGPYTPPGICLSQFWPSSSANAVQSNAVGAADDGRTTPPPPSSAPAVLSSF